MPSVRYVYRAGTSVPVLATLMMANTNCSNAENLARENAKTTIDACSCALKNARAMF